MSGDTGFATIEAPGHRLFVADEHRAAVEALGFDEPGTCRAALARGRPIAGGRGPHRLLALPGSDALLRLRPARHGGVFGAWLGDRFRSPERARRELAIWLALRRRGVDLPTPVAAIATRDAVFWRCHFAVLERSGARDGLAWLEADPDPATLRRGAVAFARALRRLHDAGVVHGDLHLRNLLFERVGADAAGGETDGGALACLFVDLDRARTLDAVPPRERLAELARLARSLEKHGLAPRVDARLRARVVVAYCAGDPSLRRALLEGRGPERRRLARHRLAWRAGRLLAGMRRA
ncbi:MAG: lipopolysaccharide kinase InaA family protein [Myxococcota bacterium]